MKGREGDKKSCDCSGKKITGQGTDVTLTK